MEQTVISTKYMLAYYSSDTPVPAMRKKKLRNSYCASESTSNLPQAETPPSGKHAKHLSSLNLSVSNQEGGSSDSSSLTSPSLSVSVSSGSVSPGSPPQRLPLPAGYNSLGRGPKSVLHSSGSISSKTMQYPISQDTKSSTSEPKYYSLDRGKPKRPAPLPQLSQLKRTAPCPPVLEPNEVNNNTLKEGCMSSDEIKMRMLQLIMLDPQ